MGGCGRFSLGNLAGRGGVPPDGLLARALLYQLRMRLLTDTRFWHMKVRIALLTLVTFIALC